MARILIVDDEETIRFAFESFLADAGHEVSVAGSIEEALERMNGPAFDLIFADIILGGRTGVEILRAVHERGLNCPVVIITGYPTLETSSEAVRLGAFDYIPKPVRQRTLLDVTERALRHRSLVEKKERYHSRLEAIFRSVKEAIITVDRNLIVTEVNDAAVETCGISRNAVGKPFDALQRSFGAGFLELLERVIREGKALGVEHVECAWEDRPNRLATIVVSPLLEDQSVTAGAVIAVKDEARPEDPERDREECREFPNIVGKSEKMQQVFSLVESLADVQTTVLVTGETGTGKELIAAALHERGCRCEKPFVKVNCSALPESLLESELFGHVKGAFTGAIQNKTGRFERADGGTIFLDEIGDISPGVQLRLLRVLQEKEFERVGNSSPVSVDVRIVAATNKDLREKMQRGEFREDLYYRLKVVEIHLPPLRERKEDIPLLTEHFREKFNGRFGKEIASVSGKVRQAFMDYPWPGNVRELEHALEHSFVHCNQNVIIADHLPREIRDCLGAVQCAAEGGSAPDRATIIGALEKTDWNKAKASRLLGISRQTMYRRIEEFGLKRTNAAYQ